MKKTHPLIAILLLVMLPNISFGQSEINWDNAALGSYTTPPSQFAALGMVECVGDNVSINPCSSGLHNWFKLSSASHKMTFGQLTVTTSLSMTYTGDSPALGLMIESATSLSGPWTAVNFTYSSGGPCYTVLTDVVNQGSYVRVKWNNDKIIKIHTFKCDNGLLPVELVAFSAIRIGDSVQLKWKTASEVNNYGFGIERSANKINWIKIGFVEGHGTVNAPQNYEFMDKATLGDNYYRLKQIDRDEKTEYSGIIQVLSSLNKLAITTASPNPFNPATTISFFVPQEQTIKLVVCDIEAREVAILKDEIVSPGSYSVHFNAGNLQSGTYFVHLTGKTEFSILKIVLAK